MAKTVTFKRDFECRLVLGDTAPAPRATISYPAGYTGLIPDHHYEAAVKAGVIDGDAKQGQASQKAGSNPGSGPKGTETGA